MKVTRILSSETFGVVFYVAEDGTGVGFSDRVFLLRQAVGEDLWDETTVEQLALPENAHMYTVAPAEIVESFIDDAQAIAGDLLVKHV